jgi:hypothetical protein
LDVLANIADQLDKRNEKSIIFASNPMEQILHPTLLRIYHIKVEAVLASMKPTEKANDVAEFQPSEGMGAGWPA